MYICTAGSIGALNAGCHSPSTSAGPTTGITAAIPSSSVPIPGLSTPTIVNLSVQSTCGSIPFSLRITTPPGHDNASSPTIIMLSGLPGSLFWIDKYAGVSNGANPPAIGSYNMALNGGALALQLYKAGFQLIELAWGGQTPLYGCKTEIASASPTCSASPSTCVYNGGFGTFFPLWTTDDYNFNDPHGSDFFNPFTALKSIFKLSQNCHGALQAGEITSQALTNNSVIYQMQTVQGVTNLTTSGYGNDIYIMVGSRDWGYNGVVAYSQQRTALTGPGPAGLVVPNGTHSFNGWPSQMVTLAVNYLTTGTP